MEEAYGWVLKFNADTPATDQDIAALKVWSARSPAHRQALKEAEDFWCEAEMLSQLAVPVAQPKPEGLGRFFSGMRGFASFLGDGGGLVMGRSQVFAAVFCLGLGVVLLSSLLPLNNSVRNGVYSTAIGEQKTLTLSDASQVQLDTHSQVQIAYEDGARVIHLLQGKAHFDVAKNPDRPFEVYAHEGLVRAVGTAFSVYLAGRDIEVLVDEGRVDLARVDLPSLAPSAAAPSSSPDAPALIDALPAARAPAGKVFLSLDRGQGAQFNRAQQVLTQLSEKELAKELAWRKGVLVFVRDPLSKVISEVGRYTHVTIEIVDPALGDMVMGGRFQVGEVGALFEVLEIGFGVQVDYLNEGHVQLRLATNE